MRRSQTTGMKGGRFPIQTKSSPKALSALIVAKELVCAGWDDIPEYIVDESATKPDEWDGDEDGEWKPPKIKNPDYKGKGIGIY